ncbi:uncharacterized protein LOC135489750 [Lineus longissimus]|uniref:uncharacterized protein LOC135489750 n=1 Tax=Lineus longissimus TaxID=88925 RepID=UPI00315D3A90
MAIILLLAVSLGSVVFGDNQCERITVRLCSTDSFPYNSTKVPNMFHNDSQWEAGLELHAFWPLVEINCSPYTREFLCSLYVPECRDGLVIPPDRRMCELTREGCEPLMLQYGFSWPERMNCTNFHYRNKLLTTTTVPSQFPDDQATTVQSTAGPTETYSTCEKIEVPLCDDIGYNYTRFPNLLNHIKQDDAGLQVHQFSPLVQVGCSPDLRKFLCSIYVPKCIDGEALLPPSRQLCLSVKTGCEPLMNRFGFEWPSSLACEKFPEDQETTHSVQPTAEPTYTTCEKIEVPLCSDDIGYNYTRFPNLLNHIKQDDAGLEVHQFFPLVKVGCSPDLRKFLCSLYVPKCIDGEALLPPSRQLCLSAKTGCEHLMNRFGFEWPSSLACDKFPDDQVTTIQPTAEPTYTTCERIEVPLCDDIGYNYTRFPNLLNHAKQDDASIAVHTFSPLVQYGCSPDLRKFLCSLYVPKCIDGEALLPPSRQLCLSAKAGCERILNRFGYEWPSSLACDTFPDDQATTHSVQPTAGPTETYTTCEKIEVPLCDDIGYNYTRFPNFLNHAKQDDAGLEVHQFFPLVKVGCSPNLRKFLCSLYVPKCIDGEALLPPSRQLCLSVKTGCEPLMNRFGFEWPSSLACEKFPEDQETTHSVQPTAAPTYTTCERIEVPLCDDIGYNYTRFPNLLNHIKQDDAGLEVHQFSPLVQVGCSPDLRKFLCSIYVPKCIDGEALLPPSRQLCLSAKAGCDSLMNRFGFEWPSSLACEKFPADQATTVQPTAAPNEISTATPSVAATCEQITSETCSSLPYSYTGFPNSLNHSNQDDARTDIINAFSRRLLSMCPTLRAFVCSLYFPHCDGGVISEPPSRRFCQHAKRSCPALFSEDNREPRFQEPSTMNCERYPIVTTGPDAGAGPEGSCRRIRNRHCLTSLSHTHTTVEHYGQGFSARERKLRRFQSLIEADCAPEAAEFLCRLYFPNCRGDDTRRPIKSLCELTRAGCQPVLEQQGKNWPRQLNCDTM